MADYSNTVNLGQAIAMTMERARLALSLAASSGRPVKVILTHKDGHITFATSIGGDA